MLSDSEFWGCASELIRQHGEDAPIMAAQRADEMLEKTDIDGLHHWQIILRRVKILLQKPAGLPN